MKAREQIERDLRNGIDLPNQREYQAKADGCGITTQALLRTLGEMERLLTLTNEVLKVTQPRGINGNLGVQWWTMNGKARWRDPVLVKWRYHKNGKRQSVEIKCLQPKMVRTAGNSKYGAEATLDLAQMAVRLIAAYKKTRASLLAIAKLAKAQRLPQALVVEAAGALVLNHKSVMGRLIAAGYEIDAKTMRLTDPLRGG